jgi:hypothetical protein
MSVEDASWKPYAPKWSKRNWMNYRTWFTQLVTSSKKPNKKTLTCGRQWLLCAQEHPQGNSFIHHVSVIYLCRTSILYALNSPLHAKSGLVNTGIIMLPLHGVITLHIPHVMPKLVYLSFSQASPLSFTVTSSS